MRKLSPRAKVHYALKHVAASYTLFLACFIGRRNFDSAGSSFFFAAALSTGNCIWAGFVSLDGSSTPLVIEEGLQPGEYWTHIFLPFAALLALFYCRFAGAVL